jgi:hypothetical protein
MKFKPEIIRKMARERGGTNGGWSNTVKPKTYVRGLKRELWSNEESYWENQKKELSLRPMCQSEKLKRQFRIWIFWNEEISFNLKLRISNLLDER